MEQTVQFIQVKPKDLKNDLLQDLKLFVQEQFTQLKENLFDEYLTLEQAADFLSVNISTIHNWRREGILKTFQIGSRVYIKRSDIDKAMVQLN